jgi:hypothetical protein
VSDGTREGFGPLPCPLCGRPAAFDLDLEGLDMVRCHRCHGWLGLDALAAACRNAPARYGPWLAVIDMIRRGRDAARGRVPPPPI